MFLPPKLRACLKAPSSIIDSHGPVSKSDIGGSALSAGTGLYARGCVKTPAFNLRVESSFRFGQSEDQSSGDGCPKKAIEKTILRFLGSRTFSHGLAPMPSLTAEIHLSFRGVPN